MDPFVTTPPCYLTSAPPSSHLRIVKPVDVRLDRFAQFRPTALDSESKKPEKLLHWSKPHTHNPSFNLIGLLALANGGVHSVRKSLLPQTLNIKLTPTVNIADSDTAFILIHTPRYDIQNARLVLPRRHPRSPRPTVSKLLSAQALTRKSRLSSLLA